MYSYINILVILIQTYINEYYMHIDVFSLNFPFFHLEYDEFSSPTYIAFTVSKGIFFLLKIALFIDNVYLIVVASSQEQE